MIKWADRFYDGKPVPRRIRRRFMRWERKDFMNDKLSRRAKKHIFGTRLKRKELRERLAAVVIGEKGHLNDDFCPMCGCNWARSTGNMVDEPQVWVQWHCWRCGHLVADADNSRTYHCLEYPELNYDLGRALL